MGRPKKEIEQIGEIPLPQSNRARLRCDSPAVDASERLSPEVLVGLLVVDELIAGGKHCFHRAGTAAKALSLMDNLKRADSIKIERMIAVAQDMLDRHNWQRNHVEDDVAEPEAESEAYDE
jgi:hypothetical protein